MHTHTMPACLHCQLWQLAISISTAHAVVLFRAPSICTLLNVQTSIRDCVADVFVVVSAQKPRRTAWHSNSLFFPIFTCYSPGTSICHAIPTLSTINKNRWSPMSTYRLIRGVSPVDRNIFNIQNVTAIAINNWLNGNPLVMCKWSSAKQQQHHQMRIRTTII